MENYRSGRVSVQDRVAVRLAEPFLLELRTRDDFIWSNPKNWKLGFYFGTEDSRLWVPRRCSCGAVREGKRVINFGHARGRPAFRLLVFGYATAIALAGALLAAALGIRW